MEGKLKQTIREADDTIARLNGLVRLFARQSYNQIAYSGRWSGVPKNERPILIKELDDALRSSGLDDEQIIALREPVVTVSAFDLTHTFINLVFGRIRSIEADLRAEADAIAKQGPINLSNASGQRHQEICRELQEITTLYPKLDGANDRRLRDHNFDLSDLIPKAKLPQSDIEKLTVVANRINLLIKAVRGTIGEVAEAEHFLAAYGRTDRLYIEIFEPEKAALAVVTVDD